MIQNMTAQPLISDCKFCSVASKSNGEDPIGTAHPFDTLLVMEISQPWTEERLMSDPGLRPIHDLFHELYEQRIAAAIMVVAPDRDYSKPGYARVMYYQRPATLFAEFTQQEFLLPEDRLAPLARTLFQHPDDLSQFAAYRQPATSIRELLVCTHGNVDVACGRFGYPIYQQLRSQYASDRLRVWRCAHFGGHQFAPTLIDLPVGQVWGHLEPEVLPVLVQQDRNVELLRQFYRGWVGLTKFEQIVEREVWMQQGWNWLKYCKSGQVLASDTANEEQDADWAEVRLDFADPDGRETGTYEARVEVCGSVMSARNSGEALTPVKQYRVSRLVRVA